MKIFFNRSDSVTSNVKSLPLSFRCFRNKMKTKLSSRESCDICFVMRWETSLHILWFHDLCNVFKIISISVDKKPCHLPSLAQSRELVGGVLHRKHFFASLTAPNINISTFSFALIPRSRHCAKNHRRSRKGFYILGQCRETIVSSFNKLKTY